MNYMVGCDSVPEDWTETFIGFDVWREGNDYYFAILGDVERTCYVFRVVGNKAILVNTITSQAETYVTDTLWDCASISDPIDRQRCYLRAHHWLRLWGFWADEGGQLWAYWGFLKGGETYYLRESLISNSIQVIDVAPGEIQTSVFDPITHRLYLVINYPGETYPAQWRDYGRVYSGHCVVWNTSITPTLAFCVDGEKCCPGDPCWGCCSPCDDSGCICRLEDDFLINNAPGLAIYGTICWDAFNTNSHGKWEGRELVGYGDKVQHGHIVIGTDTLDKGTTIIEHRYLWNLRTDAYYVGGELHKYGYVPSGVLLGSSCTTTKKKYTIRRLGALNGLLAYMVHGEEAQTYSCGQHLTCCGGSVGFDVESGDQDIADYAFPWDRRWHSILLGGTDSEEEQHGLSYIYKRQSGELVVAGEIHHTIGDRAQAWFQQLWGY